MFCHWFLPVWQVQRSKGLSKKSKSGRMQTQGKCKHLDMILSGRMFGTLTTHGGVVIGGNRGKTPVTGRHTHTIVHGVKTLLHTHLGQHRHYRTHCRPHLVPSKDRIHIAVTSRMSHSNCCTCLLYTSPSPRDA